MADSLFFLVVFGALIIVTGTAAIGAISAAPWVPLRSREIRRLLTLAGVKPGELVYDLGAGDGRILAIAAREFKAKAVGYEIAALPYVFARLRLWRIPGASVRAANFFRVSLAPADVVVCFLTPMAMTKLVPKLERELKPGARFVSYAFPLPDTVLDVLPAPVLVELAAKISELNTLTEAEKAPLGGSSSSGS
jgi:SAM-dependent methyltransferase